MATASKPDALSVPIPANIVPETHPGQPKEPLSDTLDSKLMKVTEPDTVIVAARKETFNPSRALDPSKEEDDTYLITPDEQRSSNPNGSTRVGLVVEEPPMPVEFTTSQK